MNRNIPALLAALAFLLQPHAAMADTAVTIQTYQQLAQARTLQLPARVINLQLADIAAETSGRITAFNVRVGDRVQAGQMLAELDCTLARINQDRAEAALKRLQANRQLTRQQLERAKQLSSSRSISRDELEQRETQLQAANASIDEQQAVLASVSKSVGDCQIKAPFSGTVIERMSAAGAYATPGMPLIRLLQDEAVEVQLDIPAEWVSVLQQAASIDFELQGERYPLQLRSILPWINPDNLQQSVRLSFTSSLHPPGGSYGLVVFNTPRHFLPASVIQQRQGRFGIFIARDGRAVFQDIEQAEEGQSVNIELPPDTRVITSPLQLLQDQDSISISD